MERSFLTLRILVLCAVLQFAVGADTLKFVQLLWRHGDRTPTATFPTDKNQANTWMWAGGLGELTEDGMRQHHALGKYIRTRYADFLNTAYDPKAIHVDSSHFNRTVMSAMANLGGMFPAILNLSDHTTMWKPIPVFARSVNDPALNVDAPCPTVETHYRGTTMKSADVLKVMNDNQEWLNFLRNQSGEDLATLDDISKLFDPLVCENDHSDRNPRPSWVNDTVFDKISELYNISTHFYYHDEPILRLRGGPVLGEMVKRFEDYISSPGNLKMFVYSAHDTNIVAFLESMGAYQDFPKSPTYANVIFVELHQIDEAKYKVQVLYLNETITETSAPTPVEVVISNCDDCTFEAFKARSMHLIPDDWDLECGNTVKTKSGWDNVPAWRIVAIVFIVLFGLSLIVFPLIIMQLTRKDRVAMSMVA